MSTTLPSTVVPPTSTKSAGNGASGMAGGGVVPGATAPPVDGPPTGRGPGPGPGWGVTQLGTATASVVATGAALAAPPAPRMKPAARATPAATRRERRLPFGWAMATKAAPAAMSTSAASVTRTKEPPVRGKSDPVAVEARMAGDATGGELTHTAAIAGDALAARVPTRPATSAGHTRARARGRGDSRKGLGPYRACGEVRWTARDAEENCYSSQRHAFRRDAGRSRNLRSVADAPDDRGAGADDMSVQTAAGLLREAAEYGSVSAHEAVVARATAVVRSLLDGGRGTGTAQLTRDSTGGEPQEEANDSWTDRGAVGRRELASVSPDSPQSGESHTRLLRLLLLREALLTLRTSLIVVALGATYAFVGTGLLQHRAQASLHRRWTKASASSPIDMSSASARPGESVALLTIRRIGVNEVVLEGTSRAVLRKGPGVVPGTALPGEGGTTVVVGHRSVWGSPLSHVGDLVIGDEITLSGRTTVVRYAVTAPPARVARLSDLRATPGDLVLITGDPRFHSSRLLVVDAQPQTANANPALPAPVAALTRIHPLRPSPEGELLAALLALLLVGLWFATRILVRRLQTRLPVIIAVPVGILIALGLAAAIDVSFAGAF